MRRLLAALGLVLRPLVWSFALIGVTAIAFPPTARTISYSGPDRLTVALDSGFEKLDPDAGWLYPVVLEVAIPRQKPAVDDRRANEWSAPWLGVRFYRSYSARSERLVLGLLPLFVLTSLLFWGVRLLQDRGDVAAEPSLPLRIVRCWCWIAAIVGAALTVSASAWGSSFSPAVCASGFPVDAARGARGLRIIWVRDHGRVDVGRSRQMDSHVWPGVRYGVRNYGAATYRYLVLRLPALALIALAASGVTYVRWRRERRPIAAGVV
ncbi:hypothetical protein [Alienimonas californiensis]|uniref:Uncharacterized protein n=1 Tax=Alienimonas californiensis TaxID=2527989 RepID=A0A517PFB4_9PLAN|nr:hypothetical protein [Alienimonas californiensis]QDT18062.1 hypothetical protein CA12_42010 [Alienimonas californiensis]